MRGSEHIAIAAASTLVVLAATGQTGASLFAPTAVAAIGSLSPDLDHRGSLASFGIPSALMTYGVAVVVAVPLVKRASIGQATLDGIPYLPLLQQAAWIAIALSICIGILALTVRRTFDHRGPFHSLAFGFGATFIAIFVLVAAGLPGGWALAFAWGWLSHLAADSTTKMGVPSLLWPFDPRTRSNVNLVFEGVSSVIGKLQSLLLSRPNTSHVIPEVRKQSESPRPPVVFKPRYASAQIPLCPSCGVPMIKRTAKKGSRQGEQFYGCANFPKCRKTRPLR